MTRARTKSRPAPRHATRPAAHSTKTRRAKRRGRQQDGLVIQPTTSQRHTDPNASAAAPQPERPDRVQVDPRVGDGVLYLDPSETPAVIRPAIVIAANYVPRDELDWLKAHPGASPETYRQSRAAASKISPLPPIGDEDVVFTADLVVFGFGFTAKILLSVPCSDGRDVPLAPGTFYDRS